MKKIEKHSERIQMILEEFRLTVNAFRVELGYKNNNTLTRILKGEYGISNNLIDRIVNAFPSVNIDFLKNGELPITLDSNEQLIQATVLGIKGGDTNLLIYAITNKLELMHQDIRELKKQIEEINKKEQ